MRKVLLFSLLSILPFSSQACFTILVGKNATLNHKVIIARNSDSKDARRAKRLKIYSHHEGKKLYIGLPYWDLILDPSFDMPQVATNPFGVSISATETIQSNRTVLGFDPPTDSGNGVTEPNIPSIVMPQATSAIDAVRILGKAIESRGVNDGWGFGVLFGDSHEAWYLETLSGHQWVAIRIPDNVYFVAANGPGQIQDYLPEKYTYLMSNYLNQTPIAFASQYNIAKYINGAFNFRETFADVQHSTNRNSNFIRTAYVQHVLNPSTRPFDATILNAGVYPMFLEPEHPISIDDIKTIQSSHYADYPEYDPYRWSYQNNDNHPFFYPISNPRTSNAHITEIGTPLDPQDVSIANLEYITLGMPGFSFYMPIYAGITKVPTRLTSAAGKADEHSLFWQFRKIQTLAFLHDPAKNIPYAFQSRKAYIVRQYQSLAQKMEIKQKVLEASYNMNPDAQLIDQFTQEMVDEIAHLNEVIIAHFMTELDINAQYGLHTVSERNTWFTQTLREQDCFYRLYQCEPKENNLLQSKRDRYVDEPT